MPNATKWERRFQVFSDGNAMELLLTISKLDGIEEQYYFHAKGNMRFYLQTIDQILEHTAAAKNSELSRTTAK